MAAKRYAGTQLQEWANTHQPDSDLLFKEGYWDQIIFVRDKLRGIFASTYEEYVALAANFTVISSHHSKSVLLPVFRVELADGTAFTMRDNFHDWKVSVDSPRDVEADFMDLFRPNDRVGRACCEGFPSELIYGPYVSNKKKFTIELPSGYNHIFTFFWIFKHAVLKDCKT